MRKLFSSLVLITALSFVACNNEKKADKAETKTEKVEDVTTPVQSPTTMMAAKAHACGADCTNGNHVYAHGDVGHTCTSDCGVAHVCGTACKDGNHLYAHGEAGHTCTDACTSL